MIAKVLDGWNGQGVSYDTEVPEVSQEDWTPGQFCLWRCVWHGVLQVAMVGARLI